MINSLALALSTDIRFNRPRNAAICTVYVAFTSQLYLYLFVKIVILEYLMTLVQVMKRGLVSKETVVLRRWGSETRKFSLSTELINGGQFTLSTPLINQIFK